MTTTDPGYSPGDEAWFEYHCLESLESADAHLWLRSHQRVTIVTAAETNDAMPGMTFVERMEEGTPWTYTIRFADGTTGCAVEDELMDSRDLFCRPDPPRPL